MITSLDALCKPILGEPGPAERLALARDGFCVLPAQLSPAELAALIATTEELLASEGAAAGNEVHQEAGTSRLANLLAKGACFRTCLRRPRVLACVDHLLAGDWRLSSLNYRAALPGAGGQALHADWHGPVADGDWQVCNTVWTLDAFHAGNGATRVVPGSHRWQRTPASLADARAPHPDEVVVEAPAGSVIVFNSHLWHGGTLNRSAAPRRALFAYFTRRHQPQQTDQRASLPQEVIAGFSPEERWIADL